MPYINLKTTKKVSDDKCTAIKAAFGKAIGCFPGKSEAYLMVCIEDEKKIWFAGDDSKDSAVVDVQLLGSVNSSASQDMTAEVCKILERELGILPSQVYVKYEGYDDWGWNGRNF